MNIKDGSWSIVLLGKWNKYILSPEWSAKNIFEEEKLKIEMALTLGAPPRFSVNEIIMIPSEDRVAFHLQDTSDESLQKAESCAIRLLSTLQHTPVYAFGLNFGFIEKTPEQTIVDRLEFADSDYFIERGYALRATNLIRKFEIDSKSFINLTFATGGTELEVDFNFHYDVVNSEEAARLLSEKMVQNKNLALDILNNNYNLTIEP